MLPVARRVTRQADWHRAHRFGRVVRAPEATMKAVQNGRGITRFGFSVSVKVAKHATERNIMKRRLRAAAAQLIPKLSQGFDVVIVARHQLRGVPTAQVSQILEALLKRARLLHI